MRNHPENYLAVLQQHFSVLPAGIVPELISENYQSPNQKLNTTNQQGKFTAFQRWYPFKEAFAPSFVVGAIEMLGYRPTHIIDPFGGSGTTALTAQLLDINATTIEINPFTADLIAAKATPIDLMLLTKTSIEFFEALNDTRVDISLLAHLPPTFIENVEKKRWIFPKDVALRISQYLSLINTYTDPSLNRLLKVILGSTLIPSSNVYINGKGRRYRKNWDKNQSSAADLDKMFKSQFDIVLEDSRIFEHRPECQVAIHNADSRITLASLNEPADLIVFSPPYPNSFDYTDIYNVELWVLGYLSNADDNKKLREKTLRSHVQAKRPFNKPINKSTTLELIYEELDISRALLWNKTIPEMITSYFADLEEILIHSFRLLKQKGKVVMVVGDSKYSNVMVSVADVLSELAQGIGYTQITKKEVRKMRASAQQGGSQQLGEWIIELSR